MIVEFLKAGWDYGWRSFIAGFAIGIVAMVSELCSATLVTLAPLLGAMIFPFGIMFILSINAYLYTGKIGGYLVRKDAYDIGLAPCMLVLNALGALFAHWFMPFEVVFPEISWMLLIKAIITGVLVVIAINCWRKENKLGCWISIFFFVIMKCPHCIAMAYGLDGAGNGFETWLFVVFGNTVGGWVAELTLSSLGKS